MGSVRVCIYMSAPATLYSKYAHEKKKVCVCVFTHADEMGAVKGKFKSCRSIMYVKQPG